MADMIQCPGCGKQYPANPKYQGKEVRCKRCGRVFVVPAGAVKSESVPMAQLIEDETAVPVAKLIEPSASPLSQELPPMGPANDLAPLQTPLQPISRKGLRSGARRPSWGRLVKRYRVAIGVTVGLLIGGTLLLLVITSLFSAIRSEIASKPPVPLRDSDLPDRGPMRPLGAGVSFCEVDLGVPGNQPGYMDKLYIYLPGGYHSPGSLPCVLIAPGGSSLINGIELGNGDRDEHLPYVKAGFAVVAYELDGSLEKPDASQIRQMRQAIKQYRAAECGLVNARNAMQYVSAKVPEVDTNRFYSAGHSSAGTMALLLAEHDQRIHGCVAYAPVTNLPKRFADDREMFHNQAPQAVEIIDKWSPHQFVDRMDCPVMLFHARDDSNVPYSESTDFADLLKQHGKSVTLELVPYGDHYNAMIYHGITKGVAWLTQIDGRVKPPGDMATRSLARNQRSKDARRRAKDSAAWGSAGKHPFRKKSVLSDNPADAELIMELMEVGIRRPMSEKGWAAVAKMCKKHGASKMVLVEMTVMGDDQNKESYKTKLERAIRAAGARDLYTEEMHMAQTSVWAGPIADIEKLTKKIKFGHVLGIPMANDRSFRVVVTSFPGIDDGPGGIKWPEGEFPPMGKGGPPIGFGPDGKPERFPSGMKGPPRRMGPPRRIGPRGMRGGFPR